MSRRTSRSASLLVALLLTAGAAVAERLDEGKLDPTWFGEIGELRTTEEIDYLWVADGFSIAGKKIRVAPWEEPLWLAEKRDAKDAAQAEELTERMPSLIKGALKSSLDGKAEVVSEGGDLVLTGRFVDVSAGSKAAKWLVGMGAGSAFGTFDVKLADAASGRTVAAIHHRVISGTTMSDLDDKVVKWLDEGLGAGLQSDLGWYAKGKRARK
jgi:hypothetical protein